MLSTERLSVEECVDEIENMMRKQCFQETAESLRMVDNVALEWSVRSALRRDGRTATTNITVQCVDGAVTLAGVVDTLKESAAVAEVAGGVEGAASVDNQLKTAEGVGSRYRRES